MAVVIEAFTVIVRNSTLNEKYPGGHEAFAANCPNRTYCSDGTLSRVAFMHPSDAEAFIAGLAAKGLVPYVEGAATDVALVNASQGLHGRGCGWLVFATLLGAPIAWMDGVQPTPVVGPPGYEFGRTMQLVSAKEAAERLVFLRTVDGVDVYRDKQTGEEVYVGRAPRE